MTSDEINQISFELNEDEFSDDSFSESSLYDTIDENQSIPTNVNDIEPEGNKQLVESSEYAEYNNDHRMKPWVEWLKLQRMKIIIISLLLVITVSVTVSLVSVMNSAETRVYPTVNSTTLPETVSDVSTTDVSTTPSVTKPTDVTSAYVSTAQTISSEYSTTGKTLK